MSNPAEAAQLLRSALLSGDCRQAAPLLRDYASAVAEAARLLDPRDPAARELLRDAEQTLRWARKMACVIREEVWSGLARLSAAHGYRAPVARRTPAWDLEA